MRERCAKNSRANGREVHGSLWDGRFAGGAGELESLAVGANRYDCCSTARRQFTNERELASLCRRPVAMITIRTATLDDAKDVSALLIANSIDQGGQLYGDWSTGVVTKWISSGALILIAAEGGTILGALFTSEKHQACTAPVIAMLKAWPGQPDSYVYGPACIAQAARGRGVLEALYRELMWRLPGREGILFIKRSNARSLRAHLRLKMQEVSSFRLSGEQFVVLSTRPPSAGG